MVALLPCSRVLHASIAVAGFMAVNHCCHQRWILNQVTLVHTLTIRQYSLKIEFHNYCPVDFNGLRVVEVILRSVRQPTPYTT